MSHSVGFAGLPRGIERRQFVGRVVVIKHPCVEFSGPIGSRHAPDAVHPWPLISATKRSKAFLVFGRRRLASRATGPRRASPTVAARQAAAATTGATRSSATACATRDPVPIALATDREC